MNILNEDLKDIVLKHNANGKFGVRLVHAPFDVVGDGDGGSEDKELKDKQRIINFGNVAFPVDYTRMSPEEKKRIVPTTWVFREAGGKSTAAPVEFSYTPIPAEDSLSPSDIAFFDDVQKILIEKNVSKVLGVSLVRPGIPGISFKRGGSVITLPIDLISFVPGEMRHGTLWVFPPGQDAAIQGVESGGPIGKGKFDDEDF